MEAFERGGIDFWLVLLGRGRCDRLSLAMLHGCIALLHVILFLRQSFSRAQMGNCVGGWGVGGVPLRELLKGGVDDMPLLRCARRSMAHACNRRSKDLFETSLWGLVAASKSSFCPFISVLLRLRPPKLVLDTRPAIKPQPVTHEDIDAAGSRFPLGVPIPLGEALKMRWKTHCWSQTSFWIAGGSLAWSPDGFDFAPRGSM